MKLLIVMCAIQPRSRNINYISIMFIFMMIINLIVLINNSFSFLFIKNYIRNVYSIK